MEADLKGFIKVYDGVLDENFCRNAIKKFEEDPAAQENFHNEGRPHFTHLNISLEAEGSRKDPVWQKIHNGLVSGVKLAAEKYMHDLGCSNFWPPNHALEQIRMKRYRVGGEDRFDRHIDVGDHDSARRFLVLFFYLNDVEEGGETVFTELDYSVKPKTGSVLIFPPTWQYPHAGLPPISNNKYIVGTYLHYT
jgi:hypothetical protein